MGCLSQLAGECRVCPFVSKCDNKRIEALRYFSEPATSTINTSTDGRISVDDVRALAAAPILSYKLPLTDMEYDLKDEIEKILDGRL